MPLLAVCLRALEEVASTVQTSTPCCSSSMIAFLTLTHNHLRTSVSRYRSSSRESAGHSSGPDQIIGSTLRAVAVHHADGIRTGPQRCESRASHSASPPSWRDS